ncbi:MAG: hemolysin family protein [Gudongella sp.]|nr:hemolysin family protein [Gudongella sp.]
MDIMSYISIVLLIVLSAFFSGSEIAFASVNISRLKKASKTGITGAKTAVYIYEHFEDALSTILIGNNMVNIAASSITTVIAIKLMGESGAIVATFVMTILILTFGEITPKVIAKQQNFKYTLIASIPLRILMVLLKPIITIIVWIIALVSKFWGVGDQIEPSVTEEELFSIIESIEDSGIIDEDQSDLLQSVLYFTEISGEEILTHRVDMLAIDIDDDLEDIIEIAFNARYSRIPVYENSIDNIIGVLHLGRLLKKLLDTDQIDIRDELVEVCFVHKSMKLPAIFTELKRRQLQLAIVTDEYGGTMGCITMEDVLEKLVGDIWDESDEIVDEFTQLDEDYYEVSGDLSIRDFVEYLDLDYDIDSDYNTVGGWVIQNLNGFPQVGGSFEYRNLQVEVKEIEGVRVTRIYVSITKENEDKY